MTKAWAKVDGILHQQSFIYVLEIIYLELINCHHNNLLISHFNIKKNSKIGSLKILMANLFPQRQDLYKKLQYLFSL